MAICWHFKFVWRLRYLLARIEIGKYRMTFGPCIEWQNADLNLTTWVGRYRALGRNIFAFGPFMFSQYHHEGQHVN